jgi:hypothetical protein
VEEDTAPGLVEDAMVQFHGRDAPVVAKAVAHVLLMRARGKTVETPSRMLGWAVSRATPRDLEEGSSPNLAQVDALIEDEAAHEDPSPRETRGGPTETYTPRAPSPPAALPPPMSPKDFASAMARDPEAAARAAREKARQKVQEAKK